MRETLTISLPRELRKELAKNAKAQHLTQSEFVRKAIQDKLWVDAVDASIRLLAPKARALRIHSDEDVYKFSS